MNDVNRVSRWRSTTMAVTALAVLMAACTSAQSADPVDLGDLGLMVEADIQSGGTFEVTVPLDEGTRVGVVSAPPGVEAAITETPSGESMSLALVVDPDTPPGAYNLVLLVVRNGEEYELAWPFEVVDPVGLVSSTVAGLSTPESLRDEVVAALRAKDADALRSWWPASSWDMLGTQVLADFVPASDRGGDCDRLSDTRAHCFVFQQDLPFVLGLTMEHQYAGWTVTVATLDSTN